MKLTSKLIDKHGSGQVTLIPEEAEDMWHTYNIVAVGDSLRSTTIRKVQTETATGSTNSSKVRTMLTIHIETIDFDTQAGVLRVKGKNIVENQYVKMGAYHTIDLELNRRYTLGKRQWDSMAIERMELACDPVQSADLGAVVMQEGIAHVCLVTSSMTIVRAKIDCNIPRKRKGMCDQYNKGLHKFFDQIVQAIIRHVDFDIVKCVLLGSPGFVKDQFHEYLFQVASKMDYKVLLENKSKFILVHTSSGFKHSLNEILQDPSVNNKLSDTKALSEVKALEDFYHMLQMNPNRAFYGVKHVEKANEEQAIETMLITDELFRANDILIRKRYVTLVDSARENGAEVKIFSSLHVSGEQLGQLSGVAAILRFPISDEHFEDLDSSDED